MNPILLAVVLMEVAFIALALRSCVGLVRRIERVEKERNAALAEFAWQRAHYSRLLTFTLHGAEKYRRDREGWQNEKAKFQAEILALQTQVKAKSDEVIDVRAKLQAVEEAYRGLQVTCAGETQKVEALEKTNADLEDEIRRLKEARQQPPDTQTGRSSEPAKRNGSVF